MSDGKDEAKTKLQELLGTLRDYRRELEQAEKQGDAILAAAARRIIRTHHAIIRRHCQHMGLPRPLSVPEKD